MVTYIVGHHRQGCLKTKDICRKSQVKLTVHQTQLEQTLRDFLRESIAQASFMT